MQRPSSLGLPICSQGIPMAVTMKMEHFTHFRVLRRFGRGGDRPEFRFKGVVKRNNGSYLSLGETQVAIGAYPLDQQVSFHTSRSMAAVCGHRGSIFGETFIEVPTSILWKE